MKPRLLILVTSDPRTSPRPAEAVRIAAGIGAWDKVETKLCLRDAAVLALSEEAEDLVDGDSFLRYLPLVAEANAGANLLVDAEAPSRHDLGGSPLPFRTISDEQLATLAAECTSVLRF